MSKIITVAAHKGGVGKTTIAYELATALDAIALDLEWDGGSITRQWGHRPEDRSTDWLIQALERDKTPRTRKGHRKPRLVPGSPDLVNVDLSAEDWADRFERWAGEWDTEYVVVDTHPGAAPVTQGAIAAAHLVLTPTGLRTNDLMATEQMVADFADYPLALVPNMVPRIPPAAEVKKIEQIIQGTPVQVAPVLPYIAKLGTRKRRMALVSETPPPKAYAPFVEALHELVTFTKEYVND